MATFCPHCMQETQRLICSHCGKDVQFTGKEQHLPVATVLRGKQEYILGASLGQGGFGITYIALNVATMERVAIKEYFPVHWCQRGEDGMNVYPTSASYETGKQRFFQEAKNIYRFRELKTVVNVLEFFGQNNTCYIVMEYLEGESLDSLVQRTGKLRTDELLKKLKPLMEDLDQIHHSNPPVLHRDIAPDNIMLLENGGVALLDFGSARSCQKDGNGMTKFIKQGYSPVEQYFKEGEQGPYSDVYSLAATIYYALTGKRPVDALERQSTVLGGNRDPLVPPRQNGASIQDYQEKALMDALELLSEKRTASVKQLCEGLIKAEQPASSDLKLRSAKIDRRDHTVTLLWSGKLPKGTTFRVMRSINGITFQPLDRTTDHFYLDHLPPGTERVQYRVELQGENGRLLDLTTGNTIYVRSLTLPNLFDLSEGALMAVLAVLLVLVLVLLVLLLM